MLMSDDLIEEFYTKYMERNPESTISIKEMYAICRAEFELMKRTMGGPTLEEVRLQYLFVVRPSIYKVIKYLKNSFTMWEQGVNDPKDMEYYLNLYLNHIKDEPEKYQKYEDIILQTTGLTLQGIQTEDLQAYIEKVINSRDTHIRIKDINYDRKR